MINRDPLYNHYLIMRENCINSLSFRVKSESRPQSFGFEKVEIHEFCFPSPTDVERAEDSVYVNILEKTRFGQKYKYYSYYKVKFEIFFT